VVSFAKDGVLHGIRPSRQLRDGLGTDLLSFGGKLRMWKLVRDMLRARSSLDAADLSRAAAFDTESVQEYGHREFGPEVWDSVLDPVLRGLVSTSVQPISKVDLLFSLKTFIGARFVTFAGGMGSYPERLAPLFDVQLGAAVVSVEERSGGVLVTWNGADGHEHAEEVEGCVVAVQADRAAAMLPGLDPWRREFLDGVGYSKMVAVNVALSRPPAGLDTTYVQIPTSAGGGLCAITVDHNCAPARVPDGKGLLSLYSTTEWADEVRHESDDVISERAIAAAEAVIPGFAGDIEFTGVSRWDPMVLMSRAGYYQDLARFHDVRRRTDRRIQLAGDYFATSNVGTASEAGARAAADLRTALTQPGRTVRITN
jgi:oxygen-dependent protoporphyrinogen oxidase